MGKQEYFMAHLWEKGKKEKNQDSLAFWWMNKKGHHCLLGIVCDGIGGLEEGENASTYAVKQIVAWFLSEGYRENKLSLLRQRIQQIAYQIHQELTSYGEERGISLGTTMTLFLVRDGKVLWAHWGDSRIYFLKRGKVKRLTTDHKEKKGALTRALGVGEWSLPEMGKVRLLKRDRILLCTDGFYRGLSEEEIKTVMARKIENNQTAERILKQIYQKKRSMGEKDDISVIYLGYRGKDEE